MNVNKARVQMTNSFEHKIIHYHHKGIESGTDTLIVEEPLSIRIQGNPYALVMRTPGEEIPHAAGFCLAEGIVDSPDDIANLGVCEDSHHNVVTVTLHESRRNRVPEYMDRRGYISQTSCGICGKEVISDLYQSIKPVSDGMVFNWPKVRAQLNALSTHQPMRKRTVAAHAAAIYNNEYEMISVAEDVGRHNALDKAVGKLFLDRELDQAAFLVLSSRISYEMVQKAARARIPVIIAKSRPTSLAVELASRLNLTLTCPDGKSGIVVYCGEHRYIS